MPYLPLPQHNLSLPLEVIEEVIDLFHSNVSVLREFALSCRALLPRSRYHIFFAIRIQPTQQDVDSLCNIFHANPHLADLVHIVTVYFPHGSRPAKSKKLVEVFPAKLIRGFPRLRH